MHELSIAMEILDIVRRESTSHGARTVTKVRLRIGDISGVETDSLSFCFNAVKEFPANGHTVTCPSCEGFETTLLQGEELEIADIEID